MWAIAEVLRQTEVAGSEQELYGVPKNLLF